MTFRKTTIEALFSKDKREYFVIPNYQRAYSWENDNDSNMQLKEFFDDLVEQAKSKKNYSFGNILVEKKNNRSSEVIDGQQRLTTIVIFIRAFIDIILERKKFENIDINIAELEKKYLFYNGKNRLTPCKIDREYFNNIIINNTKGERTSKSQDKIRKAKNYFKKELKSIKSVPDLLGILRKLQKSIVTVTTINNKIDSAFMFELQNNRGREITEMEQIKAFLIYQVYINDIKKSFENTIETIAKMFEKIYLCINEINKNEDEILWWHCYAYYGYEYIDGYSNIKDLLKEKLAEITEQNKKIDFISDFVSELNNTFSNIRSMIKNNTSYYLRRLNKLGIRGDLYPIIINAYRDLPTKTDKENYLENIFRICELLAFRIDILPPHGNVNLHRCFDGIREFQGNPNELYFKIKINFANWDRWSDTSMNDLLMGSLYHVITDKVIHFIFIIYEQTLSGKEFLKLKKIEIEHISPLTPDPINNSGYELTKKLKYSVKFTNNYLHCIGNLMLSIRKQQIDLSNYEFPVKLKIYIENNLGLAHQTEITKYLEPTHKNRWGHVEIEKRRDAIIAFIKKEWSFDENDNIFIK
jgi:uncharacterized protein with ParB-like and HNH nuclease domain